MVSIEGIFAWEPSHATLAASRRIGVNPRRALASDRYLPRAALRPLETA